MLWKAKHLSAEVVKEYNDLDEGQKKEFKQGCDFEVNEDLKLNVLKFNTLSTYAILYLVDFLRCINLFLLRIS